MYYHLAPTAIFLVALFVHSSAAQTGSESGKTIRYKFVVDEQEPYTITQLWESYSPPNDRREHAPPQQLDDFAFDLSREHEKIRLQLAIYLTTTDILKDGSARIQLKVERAILEHDPVVPMTGWTSPFKTSWIYDSGLSAHPFTRTRQIEQRTAMRERQDAESWAPFFEAIAGLSIEMTISPLGDVSDIQVANDFFDKIEKGPSEFRAMLSPKGLEQMLTQVSIRLPGDAVQPGFTWTKELEVIRPAKMAFDMGGYTVLYNIPPYGPLVGIYTTKYTYLGDEVVDGERLDKLGVSRSEEYRGGSPSEKPYVRDSRSSGEASFDSTAGKMVSLSVSREVLTGMHNDYVSYHKRTLWVRRGHLDFADPSAVPEASMWRTWATVDGKNSVEAQYVEHTPELVVLLKKDGATVTVNRGILCDADEQFLRSEEEWRMWTRNDGRRILQAKLVIVPFAVGRIPGEGEYYLEKRDGTRVSVERQGLSQEDRDYVSTALSAASAPVKSPEAAAPEAAAPEAVRPEQWRRWTSADGKNSLDAKFVSWAFDVVTLEKKDGTKIEVSISVLSPEDQEFLSKLRRNRGKVAK